MSDNQIAVLADNAIEADRRVHGACEDMGWELSAVLNYICCLVGGREQAELILDLLRRSGRAILAIAFTRFARHYRLLASSDYVWRAANISTGPWEATARTSCRQRLARIRLDPCNHGGKTV
jgi:hypothetical protein